MAKLLFILLVMNAAPNSKAAVMDTLNTQTSKLNVSALKEGKSSFAVFFEDSLGKRISSADIWDRTIRFSKQNDGKAIYTFEWAWYRNDSLRMQVTATGEMPSLTPLSYSLYAPQRGTRNYAFSNAIVTVPDSSKRTAKDSAFKVVLDPPAFTFPMDLEIFGLVPFKKVGEQFAIAFYEPGSLKSNYYTLTTTGKEVLQTVGGTAVSCWLLKIDYGQDSYATFWIADKTREVVKMKEYSKGRYRYKVRLY